MIYLSKGGGPVPIRTICGSAPALELNTPPLHTKRQLNQHLSQKAEIITFSFLLLPYHNYHIKDGKNLVSNRSTLCHKMARK